MLSLKGGLAALSAWDCVMPVAGTSTKTAASAINIALVKMPSEYLNLRVMGSLHCTLDLASKSGYRTIHFFLDQGPIADGASDGASAGARDTWRGVSAGPVTHH